MTPLPETAGPSALLLVAHGSPDPRHGAAMHHLAQRVRLRAASAVALGFLDHDRPTVAEAAHTLRAEGPPMVGVSLLLARGFHARFDLPRELADAGVENAGSLGLHGSVVDAAQQLLERADVDQEDSEVAVLVATAGSSQPTAHDDYATFRATLEARGQATVHLASIADGEQRLTADVCALAQSHATIAVVPALLAPGVLSDRLQAALAGTKGATRARVVVTAELGTAASIVDAVLARAAAGSDVSRSARARSSAPG